MAVYRFSTGQAALAAGVLMTAGVEGEWLLNPQRDDGTVANLPAFALLLLMALAGFMLLLAAIRDLRRTVQPRTRTSQTGATLTSAGAFLLAGFTASALVSAVLSGAPWEPTFIAFLIGVLMLAIGSVTWGLSLRRHPQASGVWQALIVSGVGAFAALAIEPDPWHDVGLVVMFASWSLIGALQIRRSTTEGDRNTVLDPATPHKSRRRSSAS